MVVLISGGTGLWMCSLDSVRPGVSVGRGTTCRAWRRGTLPRADRANADDAVPGQPWPTTPTSGPATRGRTSSSHRGIQSSAGILGSAPQPAGMPGASFYAEAFHRCPAAASDWWQFVWQSTSHHQTALRRTGWRQSTSLRIWRLGVRIPRGAHNAPGQWPGAARRLRLLVPRPVVPGGHTEAEHPGWVAEHQLLRPYPNQRKAAGRQVVASG
jgi:hypothetical protein